MSANQKRLQREMEQKIRSSGPSANLPPPHNQQPTHTQSNAPTHWSGFAQSQPAYTDNRALMESFVVNNYREKINFLYRDGATTDIYEQWMQNNELFP
jgi:hypothetical protein